MKGQHMVAAKPSKKNRYELSFAETQLPTADEVERLNRSSLPANILLTNVLWFCRLRWFIVLMLAGFGLANIISPDIFRHFGVRPAIIWPLVTALVLAIANLFYMVHADLITRTRTHATTKVNIWSQIVVDLLVLTVVIHFAGSVDTYAPFLYLIHIVLACVFFSRPESLVVTLLSCGLYSACVRAESAGILPASSIYINMTVRHSIDNAPGLLLLNVISAQAIWLVVWYLTSGLSSAVRKRTNQLFSANRRLCAAQTERTQHMLRTTHELKAPFAAIQANTQLLLKGYCGEISDAVRAVVVRISERSRRLSREIQEMLQLANLRSTSSEHVDWAILDLDKTFEWCLDQIQALAEEHHITITRFIEPVRIVGIEDHVKMLLENILSNAVLYSHENGHVKVECRAVRDGGAVVTVEDDGIGIPADKLPHIFDEYYHTDEAVQHNKGSTGLGLAIVRHVAQTHGIKINVESEVGVGTSFLLDFPPVNEKQGEQKPTRLEEKENNGLCPDS